MIKKLNRTTLAGVALALLALIGLPINVAAQTTVTQTTLSAALALPTQTAPARATTVASATGIVAGTELFIDAEALLVTAVNGTLLTVQRGVDGSMAAAHASSAIVYTGPTSGVTGSPFVFQDPPVGSCTLTSELYSLRINVTNAKIWQCTNSQWMNVIDSLVWVPASSCTASGSTATAQTNYGVQATVTSLGPVPIGASFTPVYQYASTAGTSHNFACQIPVPSRSNVVRGSYLVDATFFYGVQQTVLPAQASVLASGTFNGQAVFTSVTLPAAAATETASTVTPVRADAGTLTITPPVASFNLGTTTAGAFLSVKFSPANPIALTTDLTAYYLNVNFVVTTGVMTTNTPGWLAHYRTVTGF